MISTISARRYAQAIFQIAKANNNLDEWAKDFEKDRRDRQGPRCH